MRKFSLCCDRCYAPHIDDPSTINPIQLLIEPGKVIFYCNRCGETETVEADTNQTTGDTTVIE